MSDLQTRASAEVCHQLDVMVNYFESLCFEGFPVADAPRIRRLHSDRAREFTAVFFEKFLAHRRGIYHTLTTGYDPQANGAAERSIGLIKALASRCLMTSGLDSEFWSCAVRYAAQSLICASLLCSTTASEITTLWLSGHWSSAWSWYDQISHREVCEWQVIVLGSDV